MAYYNKNGRRTSVLNLSGFPINRAENKTKFLGQTPKNDLASFTK